MNIFTDLLEFTPCDICKVIDGVSCLFQDIGTVAGDCCTIIKWNTVMCIIYHGVGLFQFSKIIPVDVHVFQICESVRIALQIFLVAVVLHQNDVRKCAVISGVCCCCKFGLAVIRRCLNYINLESFVILCILLTCNIHSLDVEVLIPCPYSQGVIVITFCIYCCSSCSKRHCHDTCH